MEDLDFSGLQEIFRERFFQMMLRREKIRPETVERFKGWEHSGFHVGWRERKIEADDRKGLEGLLSYMERPAISLRRLQYRDDGMVHYQGTRFHPRLGIDHQLLPPLDFLALLVTHILLRYEVSIRSYGALSTTFRRKVGWIQNPPIHKPPPELIPELIPLPAPAAILLPPTEPTPPSQCPQEQEEDSAFLRKRKRSWAKLISKVYLDDPEICRSCGKTMKIIAAIAREQGDVIERVLRHLGLWDPPWKRKRKIRGPPPSSRAGSTSSASDAADAVDAPSFEEAVDASEGEGIDPGLDDDLYAIDPVPKEDDDTQA
jgi:hypothetical protein